MLNLPSIINKKPVFADPLNSSRHKYLQKKQTVLPAVNFGRMNSMMRMVKSKLLQHFDNDLDPESLVAVLDKQINNLNTRLQTYQKEHQQLKL